MSCSHGFHHKIVRRSAARPLGFLESNQPFFYITPFCIKEHSGVQTVQSASVSHRLMQKEVLECHTSVSHDLGSIITQVRRTHFQIGQSHVSEAFKLIAQT
jgi:hypothetical protein